MVVIMMMVMVEGELLLLRSVADQAWLGLRFVGVDHGLHLVAARLLGGGVATTPTDAATSFSSLLQNDRILAVVGIF